MKLYYAPNACSLSDHIALIEAGLSFETEAVDIRTKKTQSGGDFRDINPKGYVPALVLDDGQIITENIALLDFIAELHPALRPTGSLARTRLLEMLRFVSTEIHRAYKPLWHAGGEPEKQRARETVAGLLQFTRQADAGGLSVRKRAERRRLLPLRHAALGREVRDCRAPVPPPLAAPDGGASFGTGCAGARGRRAARRLNTTVKENPERRRFERPIHDTALAAAYYRLADGRLVFIHTEVPTEFSGLGIGTELARGAFDLLRQSGRKAVLRCPFMAHFFVKHPEYADIVDG
jgi:glutathione S-transferase/predicted GNAT family acetyltransferase